MRQRGMREPSTYGTPEEEARRALKKAVDLLSRRGYATAELRKRLERQSPPEAVDAALERLEASGLLDDGAWAASYVDGPRGRERSRSMLRRDLRSKGIEDEAAASVLEEHDDRAAALQVAERRVRSLTRLAPEVRARRLRDYLLRRGFAGGVVRATLDAVLTSVPHDDLEAIEG
jgi:regulatory protein